MAINIPIAESRFPCRAVFTFPSFFIARIKRTEEIKYAISIRFAFISLSYFLLEHFQHPVSDKISPNHIYSCKNNGNGTNDGEQIIISTFSYS